MRVLIPIDGSAESLPLLDRLLAKSGWYRTPLEIHLLNVQHPLPQDIVRFVGSKALHQFHHDQGMACLAAARDRLQGEGVNFSCHVVVGETADSIVHFARQQGCEQIVIAPRRRSGLPGILLGSVTARILQLADIPVLVLK